MTKKGKKDLKTIGSYLKLRGLKPDLMLSSCARRAQETADILSEILESDCRTNYLQELYFTPTDVLKELLLMQDDEHDTIFVVGHNPQLTDTANLLIDEHIAKIPTSGVVAINFDIGSWSELETVKGTLEFFIYPKQFKYYVPNQIRAILNKGF